MLVILQHGEVSVVGAWTEEDVLAMSIREEKAQSLAHLVVGALLATSDINETEQRLSKAKGSAKFGEVIGVIDDAASH